jgi:uncharacterized phosphatase
LCTFYAMTQICLVRHGETDWNLRGLVQGSTDIPLNERGYSQARAAGVYLAAEHWDYFYASPLSRAYKTAVIIGEEIGISKISTEPALQERHFGQAEGMEVALRKEFFRGKPIPGAETWEEVQARGLAVIEQLALQHPGKRILAVSHGGFIAGLLSVITNGEISPGNPPLKNACMNLLSYDGSWRVEWHNYVTPELEAVSAAR